MLTPTERTQRYNLLRALETFANRRPGIDPRDYGYDREGWKNYRSESRQVTRDLHDFRAILAAVERSEISAAEIIRAARAYSGRLTIAEDGGSVKIDYCTGQYFPTEFRKAACAVLAQALWDYHRPDTPAAEWGPDFMREKLRRMFPRRIAKRYFD